MTSCLGIYVGENIIKYAKVNKEKDNLKIEAFGVKFYKNLKERLEEKRISAVVVFATVTLLAFRMLI